MTYAQQYRTVPRGMHGPDERLYRINGVRPCAHCGTATDWVDVVADAAVCSSDCHRALATRPGESFAAAPAPTPPLLGQILMKAGLITDAQLNEALQAQQAMETYTPIGQVLVARQAITLAQLNALLDKHRKRPRLGTVLIAAGVITPEQLAQAVIAQPTRRMRLGDVLLRLGFATERQIKQAICIQLNLPFVDLAAFRLEGRAQLARLIKRTYAERHRVVPIATLGNTLTLAMDDPTDLEVIRTVEAGTGLVVNAVTATRAGLSRALVELFQ